MRFSSEPWPGACDDSPISLASCGSFMRCFSGMRLNEPVRLNLPVSRSELADELQFTELPTEFRLMLTAVELVAFISSSLASRFCLRSRQTPNEQPTAWLSRSPVSLAAMKPWHIHRRVVPSRQI